MKKKWILFFCVLFVFTLGGCLKKFDKKDVENYLNKIEALSSFRIVEGPIEVESRQGYHDEWWTIETEQFGFKEPLTFHVINYHSSGLFGVQNTLTDDFKGSIQTQLFNEYKDADRLIVKDADRYINEGYDLIYPITHRSDYEKIYPEIQSLQEHIKKYNDLEQFNIYLPIEFESDSISSSYMEGQDIGYISFTMNTDLQTLKDNITAIDREHYKCGSEYQYLVKCLEYGLWDRINEYTLDEINTLVSVCDELVEVRDMTERVLLKNIVYGRDKEMIAIGNVYHLLPQENVEGTFDNFQYTDSSGQVHSFSYENGNAFMHIDEVSELLGVTIDDGIPIVYTYIPDNYFTYFGIERDAFEKEWLNQYPEYYRYYEMKEDGLYIYGKPYQLTRLTRDNDEKVNEIRQDLRSKYDKFQIYVSNTHKVYEGIELRFTQGEHLKEEDYPKALEAISLTTLNQLLKVYNKTEPWEFSLTIRYSKEDEVKKEKKYHLPSDVIEYAWFQ